MWSSALQQSGAVYNRSRTAAGSPTSRYIAHRAWIPLCGHSTLVHSAAVNRTADTTPTWRMHRDTSSVHGICRHSGSWCRTRLRHGRQLKLAMGRNWSRTHSWRQYMWAATLQLAAVAMRPGRRTQCRRAACAYLWLDCNLAEVLKYMMSALLQSHPHLRYRQRLVTSWRLH